MNRSTDIRRSFTRLDVPVDMGQCPIQLTERIVDLDRREPTGIDLFECKKIIQHRFLSNKLTNADKQRSGGLSSNRMPL